jgi:hypothetical protein
MNGPNRRSLSRLNSVSKSSSLKPSHPLNRVAARRRDEGRSFATNDHAAEASPVTHIRNAAEALLAAGLVSSASAPVQELWRIHVDARALRR